MILSFKQEENIGNSSKNVDVDLRDLPTDPGLRPKILDYDHNIQDQIRRIYLERGPCQPKGHEFPSRNFGGFSRRFVVSWFSEFEQWLEYSVAKDVVFCLYCYIFKPDVDKRGGDRFVGQGFSNWKKKEKLNIHVGGSNSAHNQARRICESLLNQDQHIQTFFYRHSSQARIEYRTRLNAIVDCIRFLLRQGLVFCDHDESYDSNNQWNFLELLRFLANHNEDVNNVAFKNALDNLKLTSPEIQKDIVSVASNETVSVIIRDLGDSLFVIMIDESRDISKNEQMTIVLRYVNKNGLVVERFLGVEHVTSTTTLSLKTTLDNFFSRHGLSFSRLQGQGYDGASNMQGEFNGLKTLVLKENKCAYYIHCFAHQLQLVLVALAKNHDDVNDLFNIVAIVVNIVGASSKRCDLLKDKQACKFIEALSSGELSSGKCLNQETNMQCASDMC